MDSLRLRITRSIAQRGVIGTIPMCWWAFCSLLRPSARRLERLREEADARFDRENGVDTGGVVRPEPNAVVGSNWPHGVSYQAVDADEFNSALHRAEVDFSKFTFVDFGCGKGRALLLAARKPFRCVIGVEYCPELAHVATRNLGNLLASLTCSDVHVFVADAATFAIPSDPLVLFFFNPFGEAVMARVVENVKSSIDKDPRPIVVIYFTPWFVHLWEGAGFKRIAESPAILTSHLP